MLLYTEKQLDKAYRIDCKARTLCNEEWVTREDFRPLYEDPKIADTERAKMRDEILQSTEDK